MIHKTQCTEQDEDSDMPVNLSHPAKLCFSHIVSSSKKIVTTDQKYLCENKVGKLKY